MTILQVRSGLSDVKCRQAFRPLQLSQEGTSSFIWSVWLHSTAMATVHPADVSLSKSCCIFSPPQGVEGGVLVL